MDECDFPKCRQYAIMGYIGKNICYEHWCLLCQANITEETKLLKKIGLIRNKKTSIVSQRKTSK